MMQLDGCTGMLCVSAEKVCPHQAATCMTYPAWDCIMFITHLDAGRLLDPNPAPEGREDAARMTGKARCQPCCLLPAFVTKTGADSAEAGAADPTARGDQILWLHPGQGPATASSISHLYSVFQVCQSAQQQSTVTAALLPLYIKVSGWLLLLLQQACMSSNPDHRALFRAAAHPCPCPYSACQTLARVCK